MATTAELLNSIWKSAKETQISLTDVKSANKINDRYAREVLGLMVNKGILIEDADTMEYTAATDVTGQQVADVINQLTPPEESTMATATVKDDKVVVEKKATKAAPKNNITDCLCGCKDKVAGKSLYKPGHDARHAGQVARQVVDLTVKKAKAAEVKAAYATLPSEKLQSKAHAIADRMVEKIKAKSATKADAK